MQIMRNLNAWDFVWMRADGAVKYLLSKDQRITPAQPGSYVNVELRRFSMLFMIADLVPKVILLIESTSV